MLIVVEWLMKNRLQNGMRTNQCSLSFHSSNELLLCLERNGNIHTRCFSSSSLQSDEEMFVEDEDQRQWNLVVQLSVLHGWLMIINLSLSERVVIASGMNMCNRKERQWSRVNLFHWSKPLPLDTVRNLLDREIRKGCDYLSITNMTMCRPSGQNARERGKAEFGMSCG